MKLDDKKDRLLLVYSIIELTKNVACGLRAVRSSNNTNKSSSLAPQVTDIQLVTLKTSMRVIVSNRRAILPTLSLEMHSRCLFSDLEGALIALRYLMYLGLDLGHHNGHVLYRNVFNPQLS